MPYLGDCATRPIAATSVDCQNAKASVAAMNATFQRLGSPDAYSGSVASINAAWAVAEPSIYIIGLCGSAFDVGTQADGLNNRMLSDNGEPTVAGPTCGDPGFAAPVISGIMNVATGITDTATGVTTAATSLTSLLPILAIGALVVFAMPYIGAAKKSFA